MARTMYLTKLVISILALFSIFASQGLAASKSKDAVKLQDVKALTFRKDKMTSSRRVGAVPQISCTGGSARGLYTPDTIRCTNSGSSYSSADVEWTCTSSLPPEFKLGSTEVVCEGYDSSDDDYVLKGSCGVEYRLILTDLGEEKYGGQYSYFGGRSNKNSGSGSDWVATLFWIVFVAVVAWMLYSAFFGRNTTGNIPRTWGGGRGGGGGGSGGSGSGGGGGGGWGGGNNDPPPPYSRYQKQPPTSSSSASQQQRSTFEPGFFTRAATQAGMNAFANRIINPQPRYQYAEPRSSGGWFGGSGGGGRSGSWFGGGGDQAESSSGRRWGGSGGSSSSSSSASASYSNSRVTSTGFGGTRRR